MDSTAIKAIQELVLAANIQPQTDAPTVVLPAGFGVCSLDEHMAQPSRFKARFTTHQPQAFFDYVLDNDGDAPNVFVDGSKAQCIFDLGTPAAPKHGNHVATLVLEQTAEYKALLAFASDRNQHSQRELAHFLEDWRDNVECISDQGESVDLVRAVGSVRNMKVKASHESTHTAGDMGASRSAMDEIAARGKEVTVAGFNFSCIPYNGLGERRFYVRILVGTEPGAAPVIRCRITRLEKAQDEITDEFAALVRDKLDKLEVWVGRLER